MPKSMHSTISLSAALVVCFCGLTAVRAQDAPKLPAVAAGSVIEGVEIHGARRIPQDVLKTLIRSKPGDAWDQETVRRDFMTLWNTKRFDDIQLKTEFNERGGLVLVFIVREIQVR
jgi:outer membrane protein assembly factor BamA